MDRRKHELRESTVGDYERSLSDHLLPFFAGYRVDEITVQLVDRYRAYKVSEGRLANNAVNKTLTRLSQILEDAFEYGLIDRNPARGRKRRAPSTTPRRSSVEPEQFMALLEGADPWHRPIVATLAGAGLRVSEACALDWRDVNLAAGTLKVGDSKTAAGEDRVVDLPGGLVDALSEWKARSPSSEADDPVFVSRPRKGTTSRQTKDNVGRPLKGAIARANERLAESGIEPISEKVSPHSLRRTYISLRAASRDDPVYIAEQVGHTDPPFTLRVYAKAAKRRERLSGAYRDAYDRALQWAALGSTGSLGEVEAADRGPRFRSTIG